MRLGLAAAAAIVMSAPALAAPAAIASPATDEYSLDIPGGGGSDKLEPKGPTPDESELPASVRDELGDSRLDQTLVQAGTAPELGASVESSETPEVDEGGGSGPAAGGGGSGEGLGAEQRSVASIVSDGASSTQGLVLLLAILGAGTAAVLFWVARRRESARPTD